MSNLSREARERLPLWQFGLPSHKLFPVIDSEDLLNAPKRLTRRTDKEEIKQRMIAAARRLRLPLPPEWSDATAMSATVSFSDDAGGSSDANDDDLSGAVDDAILYAQAVNEKRPTRSPRAADHDEADYVTEAREQAERFAAQRNQQRNRKSER